VVSGQPVRERLLWPELEEPRNIGLVDVRTGSVRKLVVDLPALDAYPSPDGAWLAVSGQRHQPDPGAALLLSSLWIVSSSGGPPLITVDDLDEDLNVMRHEPAWSPSGSTLALIKRDKVLLVDPTGSSRELDGPPRMPPSPLAWLPDGRHLVVASGEQTCILVTETGTATTAGVPKDRRWQVPLRNLSSGVTLERESEFFIGCRHPDTGRSELWRVPLDGGEASVVWETDSGVANFGGTSPMASGDFDMTPDGGTVVFSVQSATKPKEFWVGQPPAWDRTRPAAVLNPEFHPPPIAEPKILSWRRASGEYTTAAVLVPEGPGPWPTVLQVYPGVRQSLLAQHFGEGAIVPYLVLLQAGYAVVLPDMPRTGAQSLEVGKARDVAASVHETLDRAVAEEITDPGRVALLGHSAGGWLVNLLVTLSDRFAGAVSASGVGDLAFFHSELSFRPGYEWLTNGTAIAESYAGGPPWSEPNRYRELSPLYGMDKVTTPLLLIHGKADPAVPWSQSAMVFGALARLDKPVTLALYEDECHVPVRFQPEAVKDVTVRVLAFLNEVFGQSDGLESSLRA
jgi:dipeptidyl aminopeptidase/acylaminoacyl peptidase